ncbi:MAG: hypothetical protein WAW13_04120 [Minisyncoccia bacterium]
MKILASLILLGFAGFILCGSMVQTHETVTNMHQHSASVAHHLSVFEDFSTVIFSEFSVDFMTFISILSFTVVAFFLSIQDLWIPTSRIVPKRKSPNPTTYKLKRWTSLFEHSPSFA